MGLGSMFGGNNSGGSNPGGFKIAISMQSLETTAANILRVLATLQQTIAGTFANAGVTPTKVESGASTNATSITAVSTVLRDLNVVNTTATIYYLKLYDKASAPTVGTDVPKMTIACYVNATTSPSLPAGVTFTLGLALALTGAATNADTSNAAAGLQINLGYS